jgi:hypothetical protein
MNLATAPNVVFYYFLYFSSPFANFSKGLEIRLSLSPATLFPGASLPNHTKMFELVHLVTSMEDFGRGLTAHTSACTYATPSFRRYNSYDAVFFIVFYAVYCLCVDVTRCFLARLERRGRHRKHWQCLIQGWTCIL